MLRKIFVLVSCFVVLSFVFASVATPALSMGKLPEKGKVAIAKNLLEGEDEENPFIITAGFNRNIWVYPTGLATIDANSVNAAIELAADGGHIHLMAGPRFTPNGKASDPNTHIAFNFGEGSAAQHINITKNVTIMGEKLSGAPDSAKYYDPNGSYNADFLLPDGTYMKSDRATIVGGGSNADYVQVGAIDLREEKYLAVSGIRFERPIHAAIFIHSCTGASINDIVVTNVQFIWLMVPGEPPVISEFAMGIEVDRSIPLEPTPPPISGTLDIMDNYIDIAGNDISNDLPDSYFWGIGVNDIETQLTANINRNMLNNAGGIFTGGLPLGEVFIEENEIYNRQFKNYHVSEGSAIRAISHIVEGAPKSHIIGNRIELEWSGNYIPVEPPFGYGIMFEGEDCIVSENIIEGDAVYGIVALEECANSEVSENDLSGLTVWFNQLGVMGNNNTFKDNTYGSCIGLPFVPSAPFAIIACAGDGNTFIREKTNPETVSSARYGIVLLFDPENSLIAENNTFEDIDLSKLVVPIEPPPPDGNPGFYVICLPTTQNNKTTEGHPIKVNSAAPIFQYLLDISGNSTNHFEFDPPLPPPPAP